MTTTTTASEFAAQLRTLADLYDAEPDLPVPDHVAIYAHGLGLDVRGAFLAVRRLFPHGRVDTGDNYYVRVSPDGLPVQFSFAKADVGEKQTVTRQVVEYVLPELEPASA